MNFDETYLEVRTSLCHFREALMLCVSSVITERRPQFQLVLIILFQAVQRRTKRFVLCDILRVVLLATCNLIHCTVDCYFALSLDLVTKHFSA